MTVRRLVEDAGWVVLGLSCLFALFALTARPVGFDLGVYLRAAEAVSGGSSPYRPSDSPECGVVGCFLYPPPVALAFVPLLALPRPLAVWGVVALLAGVAAALATVLVAPLPRALRPWAATAIAAFFPLLLELNVANLNLVSAALALAAWATRERPRRSGVLLAIAVGLKLLVAPLVLFYVAAGRYRVLAWAALAAAAAVIATVPWVGGYWGEGLGVIARQVTGTGGAVRPAALGGAPGQLATAALAAAIAVAAGLRTRRAPADAWGTHELALAASPLAAYGIYYTFLILALPLLASAARALAGRPYLLVLPALAWLGMELPDVLPRFAGLVGATAMGAVLFLPARSRAAA